MPQAGDTSAFKFYADTWDTAAYGDCFYWARDNNGHYLGYDSEDSTQVDWVTWTRNVWLDVKCYGTTMEIEGAKRTSSKPYSDPPKRAITLFGGKLRTHDFSLKAMRMLEDDVVTMDLKPAIDSSNVACFYDVVSKKKLYSANGKQMKGVLA